MLMALKWTVTLSCDKCVTNGIGHGIWGAARIWECYWEIANVNYDCPQCPCYWNCSSSSEGVEDLEFWARGPATLFRNSINWVYISSSSRWGLQTSKWFASWTLWYSFRAVCIAEAAGTSSFCTLDRSLNHSHTTSEQIRYELHSTSVLNRLR